MSNKDQTTTTHNTQIENPTPKRTKERLINEIDVA